MYVYCICVIQCVIDGSSQYQSINGHCRVPLRYELTVNNDGDSGSGSSNNQQVIKLGECQLFDVFVCVQLCIDCVGVY